MLRSMWFDAILAILDGRLEESVEITGRMLTRAGDLGLSEHVAVFAPLSSPRLSLHLGRDLESLGSEL